LGSGDRRREASRTPARPLPLSRAPRARGSLPLGRWR
jgi:hypothetical protein